MNDAVIVDRSLCPESSPGRALLRLLSTAHTHTLDASELVRRLAGEYSGDTSFELHRLSELLSSGVPVIEALSQTPHVVDPSTRMALQLAEQDGKLESVYQSLVTQDPAADTGSAMDDEHPKGALARTGAGLAVALLLITFFVTFILPTFEKMFDEFGITLPTMLLLLISSATGIRVIAILLFLLVVFLYLFSPVWKRLTSTTNSQGTQFDSPKTKLLSLLALGVQSPQGIETSIDVLAKNHPVESIRRQLGRAHTRITHGEDVMTALHSAKVLNSSESLALQMTASSSARAWLMQWFASRRQRRTRFWNSVIVKSISTVSTVFLGVIVAWTAIGVMMALYSMISDLA